MAETFDVDATLQQIQDRLAELGPEIEERTAEQEKLKKAEEALSVAFGRKAAGGGRPKGKKSAGTGKCSRSEDCQRRGRHAEGCPKKAAA